MIIIRIIDTIIRAIEFSADVLVSTTYRVSQRIASLLFSLLRLGFYFFPLITMMAIGSEKNIKWLLVLAATTTGLCILLCIREFIAHSKNIDNTYEDLNEQQRQIVNVFFTMLNMGCLIYFGYQYGIFPITNPIEAMRRFMN